MRRSLRVVAAVALYYAIYYAEAYFRMYVLGIPAFATTSNYLPDAPGIVNLIVYHAIPIAPLAVAAWFYRGGKRWAVTFAAVTLFVAFLWLPWLSGFTTPLPVDKVAAEAVKNGYEVCGVYIAGTDWSTFTYEGTYSKLKRCFFIFLRPEPRFNYRLRVNLTADITLLKYERVNGYTFYFSGFPVSTDLYYTYSGSLPDVLAPAGNPVKYGNLTIKPFREQLRPHDVVHWFTFSPEPGKAEVKVTLTIRLKAEVSTPWQWG